MDYEKTPRATLILYCTDNARHQNFDEMFDLPQSSTHELIRVTVAVQDRNDNSPRFIRDSYFARIPEHSPEGTFVVRVTAVDADEGEYGELTYHLSGVTYSEHAPENQGLQVIPFLIDRKTGTITVLQPLVLDREMSSSYSFQAIAKDKGGLTAHTLVEIELTDVNDNTPSLMSSEEFSLTENSRPDTMIGRIHLVDHDQGINARIHLTETEGTRSDTMRFIRLASDPNFRYSSGYAVNNDSAVESKNVELVGDGEVRALLLSRVPVDRETHSVLHFVIIAFDEGEPSRTVTTTVTVNILDQNDNAPTVIYPLWGSIFDLTLTADRRLPVNSHVTRVHASDPDEGENGTVVYHIQPETNGSGIFSINSTSGELLTQRSTRSRDRGSKDNRIWDGEDLRLDRAYPVPGVYEITLLVTDAGKPVQATRHKIYVKIHPSNLSVSTADISIYPENETLLQSFIRLLRVNKTMLVSLGASVIVILLFISICCLWYRTTGKTKSSKRKKLLVPGNCESNPTETVEGTACNEADPNSSETIIRTLGFVHPMPDNSKSMLIDSYGGTKDGETCSPGQTVLRGIKYEFGLLPKADYGTVDNVESSGMNFCPRTILPPHSCCTDRKIVRYFR